MDSNIIISTGCRERLDATVAHHVKAFRVDPLLMSFLNVSRDDDCETELTALLTGVLTCAAFSESVFYECGKPEARGACRAVVTLPGRKVDEFMS
jgi:hypothetical protein